MPIAGLAISTWHRIICLPKPSTSFMVTLSSSRSCYRHLNLCLQAVSRKVLISQPSSSKFCSLGFVKSTIFWKCNNLRFLVYRLNISKRSNLNKLCLLVRCCLPLCTITSEEYTQSLMMESKKCLAATQGDCALERIGLLNGKFSWNFTIVQFNYYI